VFGRDGSFPFRFGGGEGFATQERKALKTELCPERGVGYNPEDPLLDIECHAHGLAIGMIWAVNRRTQNQAIPEEMLEELTRNEEILRLNPAPTDTDQDRRAAVAGTLRGLSGNGIADIEDTARKILGRNFVKVQTVATADIVAYWSGVNPGPPGYEWSSNASIVGIHMTRNGLSDEGTIDVIRRLTVAIDAMLPAPMTFRIGLTGGFICDVGVCDLTLL
jgi:hypothetical protein